MKPILALAAALALSACTVTPTQCAQAQAAVEIAQAELKRWCTAESEACNRAGYALLLANTAARLACPATGAPRSLVP